MKKMFLSAMLITSSVHTLLSQSESYRFDAGASVGISGYIGDANSSNIFNHPGANVNIYGRYLANPRFWIGTSVGYSGLTGSTSNSGNALPCNGRFKSEVYDLTLNGGFNFLPYGNGAPYEHLQNWTPFISIGAALAIASHGSSVSLSPAIPLGVGLRYRIATRVNLGLEFSMTKVFSDKIDGPELNDPLGIKSGFAKNTDWYSKIALSVSYEFGKRCPTCNYIE